MNRKPYLSNVYKMDADLRYFVLIYLGRKRSLVRLYLVISRDLQSLVITCVISRTNMLHRYQRKRAHTAGESNDNYSGK